MSILKRLRVPAVKAVKRDPLPEICCTWKIRRGRALVIPNINEYSTAYQCFNDGPKINITSDQHCLTHFSAKSELHHVDGEEHIDFLLLASPSAANTSWMNMKIPERFDPRKEQLGLTHAVFVGFPKFLLALFIVDCVIEKDAVRIRLLHDWEKLKLSADTKEFLHRRSMATAKVFSIDENVRSIAHRVQAVLDFFGRPPSLPHARSRRLPYLRSVARPPIRANSVIVRTRFFAMVGF